VQCKRPFYTYTDILDFSTKRKNIIYIRMWLKCSSAGRTSIYIYIYIYNIIGRYCIRSMCATAWQDGRYRSNSIAMACDFSSVSFRESESSIEFSDDSSKRSLRQKSFPRWTDAVVITL